MLRRVALERTDVSEELSASFIRVTRIGELGTMLAVTSNRRTLRRNTREIQEPHGVTSQKTPFFTRRVCLHSILFELNDQFDMKSPNAVGKPASLDFSTDKGLLYTGKIQRD
jgi:hypothetical protein